MSSTHLVIAFTDSGDEITVLFLILQSGLTLSSDGILGPLSSDLPAEGLDLSDVPAAANEL